MKDTIITGGIVIGFVSIIIALVLCVAIPIDRVNNNAALREFNSIKNTVETARTRNPNDYERAALQIKIADANGWLAKAKYYNSIPVMRWGWPNEVDRLEPIK